MDFNLLFYALLCLVLIGFFSGIEIAFVSLNRLSVDVKKKQGSWSAKQISKYFNKPELFITSSLVGLNIVLICFGLIFQKLLTPLWTIYFPGLKAYPFLIFIVEIVLSTTIIFLLGEFLPKAVFKSKNSYFLILLAPFIFLMFFVLKPITNFFVFLSQIILQKILRLKSSEQTNKTFRYVDLEHFIAEKTLYEKVQHSLQNQLLKNVLEFYKTQIRACLIPRNEIKAVNVKDSIEEVKKKFIDSKLSRVIVYKNNLDNIVGYIHHIDLFKNPKSIKSILIPIPVFSETTKINVALSEFTKQRKSLGWVIDEYGITSGIITMEKILEEVFGQDGVEDEYFINKKILQRRIKENEYVFSGRIELDYLKENFLIVLPKNGYETLSGFLIEYYGSIPKVNEIIVFREYEFLIIEVTDKKIEKIKLKINDLVGN